ncbi:MAG: hypothetical protein ACOYOV_17705 [Bacteroidales bacterium]
MIEIQSNSFDHLKEKTQNDYIKYLDAFDNGEMVYWYSDKVIINEKVLNDTTAKRIGIENHVLLRKRLKIENEIKMLTDRTKLFRNLLENKKIAMNKINYIDILFNHSTKEPFLIDYLKRERLKIDVSDEEFFYECNDSLKQVKLLFLKSNITFDDNNIFKNSELLIDNNDFLINSLFGYFFSARKVLKIEKALNDYKSEKTLQITDADSNEKSDYGKNMNLDLLNDLFIPEMTRGNKPTKLDQLKEGLRANVCIYKAYQITALSSIIYSNGTLHKNTKPYNFIDWLKMFCEIIDYPTITNYKQSSKQVKDEVFTLKNTYYYFIP